MTQATTVLSRECAEAGCGRLAEYHCNGYCQPHYRRRLKAGTSCAIEGCGKPEYRGGYCQGHWNRVQRHGDPGPAELRARRRFGCLVEDCERKHFARGYCRAHYSRWRRRGDPGGAEFKPRRRAIWSKDGTEGRCVECSETKPADEFYERYGRRLETCKECVKAQRKRWRDGNPELYRERMVGYRLSSFYGISREGYEALLESQGGRCAICGTEPSGKRLAVDHCHDTGAVRGLLCFACNTGIGLFGNDPGLLEHAAGYLEATA